MCALPQKAFCVCLTVFYRQEISFIRGHWFRFFMMLLWELQQLYLIVKRYCFDRGEKCIEVNPINDETSSHLSNFYYLIIFFSLIFSVRLTFYLMMRDLFQLSVNSLTKQLRTLSHRWLQRISVILQEVALLGNQNH